MSEPLSCKLCGAAAPVRFSHPADRHPRNPAPTGPAIPYHGCTGCGLLFSTHLDAPGAVAPYGEDYFEAYDQGATARAELPLQLVRQASRWLGRAPGDVLDFGSGTGQAVARMREAGLTAYGVDIAPPEVAAGYIQVGLLDAVGRYDAVTAVEVFEHLNDPVAGAGAIATALKPGGLLAMTTSLHDPLTLDPDWWYIAPGAGHVSLHTRHSLATLAAQTGFHVLLMTPTNHLWIKGPLGPLALAGLRARLFVGRLRDKLGR